MERMSLLDLMAVQVQCEYLSDLRYLDDYKRSMLAQKLRVIPAEDEDIDDWNDALSYLTGDFQPMDHAEQAKEMLLEVLMTPTNGKR